MTKSKYCIGREKLMPLAKKLVEDAAKGYVFGSVFGIFTGGRRSVIDNMHNTGKTFAKMSVAYSAAEFALETIRDKKDMYNSVVAGGVAGAFANTNNKLLGAAIFGSYAGLSEYLQEEE